MVEEDHSTCLNIYYIVEGEDEPTTSQTAAALLHGSGVVSLLGWQSQEGLFLVPRLINHFTLLNKNKAIVHISTMQHDILFK